MRKIILTKVSRAFAHKQIDEAPDGWVCSISEPTRNLEQNAKLHAILYDIAKVEPWAGEFRNVETWKRLMTPAWLRARGDGGAELLPAVDGHGFDVLYRRTSTLSVKEMVELIDYVESWWASRQAERNVT